MKIFLKSIKSLVELNSLFLKFFYYITCFDETRDWRPCKRGLYAKPFFETIAERIKNYKLSFLFQKNAYSPKSLYLIT